MQHYDIEIIYIENEISKNLAKECLESCNKLGYQASLFKGFYGPEVESKFTFSPFPNLKDNKQTLGAKGCFLSHYELWTKCLIKNKPIVILEHDALLIRKFPNKVFERFCDAVNLDKHSRTIDQYSHYCDYMNTERVIRVPGGGSKKNYNHHNVLHIKGAHAYVLHPAGARKLIEFTNLRGWLPVDMIVNSIVLNLYATESVIARINPKYFIEEKRKSKYSFTR